MPRDRDASIDRPVDVEWHGTSLDGPARAPPRPIIPNRIPDDDHLRTDEVPPPRLAHEYKRPTLSVRVRVDTLRDINHQRGSFQARITVYFYWMDPNNVGRPSGTKLDALEEAKSATGSWVPQIRFENFAGGRKAAEALDLRLLNGSTGETRLLMHLSGEFFGAMDLRAFPFDVQKLEIRVRLSNPSDLCRIERAVTGPTTGDHNLTPVVFDDDLMLLDWNVHWADIVPKYEVSSFRSGETKPAKPAFRIVIPVSRAHWHYGLHVVAFLFLLSSFNYVVFFVPLGNLTGRTGIIFTLLLTTVAMKFLLRGSLPVRGESRTGLFMPRIE